MVWGKSSWKILKLYVSFSVFDKTFSYHRESNYWKSLSIYFNSFQRKVLSGNILPVIATLFYIISSTEGCICPTMTREQQFCNSDFSELFQSLWFEDFFSCKRTKYFISFFFFWIDNYYIVFYEEIDSIFNYWYCFQFKA